MASFILIRIPDADTEENDGIGEDPQLLVETLLRFFGDAAIDAHVHCATPQLEAELERQVQAGELPQETL